MYTPVNPSFTIKVMCKGVFITRTCFRDGYGINKISDNMALLSDVLYEYVNLASLNFQWDYEEK